MIEVKTIGEVCEIICGQDYKSVQDEHGPYPIYGSGGPIGYASQYRCPANSIIIGRKGSINNPIFVEQKFWNVDTAFGIVPNSQNLMPKYFFYFCKNYDFTKHDVSVTIPSLRRSDILKISLPIPPLAEQARIVGELDLLAGIVDKQKAQLKELDTLAQSIFYSSFGDPIENEKGWKTKMLGNVCKTTSGGTPSKKHTEYYENGNIPWLRSGELDKTFITGTELCITEQGVKNSSAKWFPVNTVVIAMYGATVGQVGILKNAMTTNQAVCGIFPNDIFAPIYLYYFLRSMKSEFIKLSSGGAQPNISQSIIRDTVVNCPPISLQNAFAEQIEHIEQQKNTITRALKQTQNLFEYTMDKYFG